MCEYFSVNSLDATFAASLAELTWMKVVVEDVLPVQIRQATGDVTQACKNLVVSDLKVRKCDSGRHTQNLAGHWQDFRNLRLESCHWMLTSEMKFPRSLSTCSRYKTGGSSPVLGVYPMKRTMLSR
jgi:hypothetical protein